MKTLTYNPETHKLPPLPSIGGVLGYTRAQMIDYASKAVKLSHAAPSAEEAKVPWVSVIDSELVGAHLDVADAGDDFETAKRKLNSLISWHIAVATDPAVNGGYKLVKAEEAPQQERWCPDVCPITGLPFFMWIEHHETGQMVPTYGGPYDSYTIPVRDDDGSYCRERYDHDNGWWVTDEIEDVGIQIVSDQAYVSDEPPQQPATHGETVAIVVDAYDTPGLQWLCQDPPGRGTRLYTAPQPTPSHIKAMWFALNILEQSRLTTSNKIIRDLCQQAITALQNALKGTT